VIYNIFECPNCRHFEWKKTGRASEMFCKKRKEPLIQDNAFGLIRTPSPCEYYTHKKGGKKR